VVLDFVKNRLLIVNPLCKKRTLQFEDFNASQNFTRRLPILLYANECWQKVLNMMFSKKGF